MRKACANCLYSFYLGDYPNCFCHKNNEKVKATGICENWTRKRQSVGMTLNDAFWEFVADGLARHNENIKKSETINEHNDKTRTNTEGR